MSVTLDLTSAIPLTGTSLIEASAGTGKTYSIANLYLHAVLSGKKVGEILVVTFTEAATKELRERIRHNLSVAVDYAADLMKNEDSTLRNIVDLYHCEESEVMLRQAVLSFDEAAVYTIHGFCQRMLSENAFESKAAFDSELLTDNTELLQRIVDDFWRREVMSRSREELEWLKSVSRGEFLSLARELVKNPELQFTNVPDENDPAIDSWKVESEVAKTKKARDEAAKMVVNWYAGCLQVKFASKFHDEFSRIKERANVITFDDLLLNLRDALKAEGKSGPLHKLIRTKFAIALVDEFQDTDSVQYQIFSSVFGNPEHGFFMIGDPKQSIYKFRGADIYCYLQAKKDAVNHYTLDTNYRSEKGMVAAVNALFMNKGADDAFAFPPQDGREGISFEAVNAGAPKIGRPVLKIDGDGTENLHCWWIGSDEPKNKEDLSRLTEECVADEIVRLLNLGAQGKAWFEGKGRRNLQPGDVAILVNSHHEAAQMRKELSRRGVPAVVQKSGNVFKSDEALSLLRWLLAVSSPREETIRSLLPTSLMQWTAEEIFALDDCGMMQLFDQFSGYLALWRQHGFVDAFYCFMAENGVRANVLALAGGERVMTNLLQLAELLHGGELEQGVNPDKLIRWLNGKIHDDSPDHDEFLQRMETDAQAVNIMTVHKSKGLEFPVVFCPYFWSRSFRGRSGAGFMFTEFDDGGVAQFLELGADEGILAENSRKLWRENLEEHLRLLYVALTRAGNRCYLVAGDSKNVGMSCLWYLFSEHDVDNVIANVPGNTRAKSCVEFLVETRNAFKGFAKSCLDAKLCDVSRNFFSEWRYNPPVEEKKVLTERHFTPRFVSDWGVGSFSWLTRHAGHWSPLEEQVKDVDAGGDGAVLLEPVEPSGVFALPKGAQFGTAIHAIFENHFNFNAEDFNVNDHLLRPLRAQNIFRNCDESAFVERLNLVKKLIAQVLDCNLSLGDAVVKLADVEPQDARTELEFFYPLKRINAPLLRNLFLDHAGIDMKEFGEQLGSLNFNLRRGFMNGFIDLIFRHDGRYYIVDWKTNYLGPSLGYYTPDKVKVSMAESWYILQYHIYTLALHLHLKNCLPNYSYETHFGGAVYLYVRGVDGEYPGNGVFFDCPKRELVEAMEEALIED